MPEDFEKFGIVSKFQYGYKNSEGEIIFKEL